MGIHKEHRRAVMNGLYTHELATKQSGEITINPCITRYLPKRKTCKPMLYFLFLQSVLSTILFTNIVGVFDIVYTVEFCCSFGISVSCILTFFEIYTD